MRHRRSVYYLFRLHINAPNLPIPDLFTKALTAGQAQRVSEHLWCGLYTDVLDINGEMVITGHLVKFKDSSEEHVVLRDRGAVGVVKVEDSIVAQARYYYHEPSGIVAHQVHGSAISAGLFRRTMVKLLGSYDGGLFLDVSAHPLVDEVTVHEAIGSLAVVKRLQITLHPSNPSARDSWRDIDVRMQNMAAGEQTLVWRAEDSRGLKVEPAEPEMQMANDGYGSVTAYGEDQSGKAVTVKSHVSQAMVEGPDEDRPTETIAAALLRKVRKFIVPRGTDE